jgi:hypothetical protein
MKNQFIIDCAAGTRKTDLIKYVAKNIHYQLQLTLKNLQ